MATEARIQQITNALNALTDEEAALVFHKIQENKRAALIAICNEGGENAAIEEGAGSGEADIE